MRSTDFPGLIDALTTSFGSKRRYEGGGRVKQTEDEILLDSLSPVSEAFAGPSGDRPRYMAIKNTNVLQNTSLQSALDAAARFGQAARGQYNPMMLDPNTGEQHVSDDAIHTGLATAGMAATGAAPRAVMSARDPSTLGMFIGRNAREHFPEEAYQKLIDEGMTPKYMRDNQYETWEKARVMVGPDFNPLSEIADNTANLMNVTRSKYWTGQQNLGDILDHPTLYESYPDLPKLKVHFANPDEVPTAHYSSGSDTITLGGHRDLATLLHEIQHAISTRDNVAGGSNPSGALDQFYRDFEKMDPKQRVELRKDLMQVHPDNAAYQFYMDHYGEQLARATEERMTIPSNTSRPVSPEQALEAAKKEFRHNILQEYHGDPTRYEPEEFINAWRNPEEYLSHHDIEGRIDAATVLGRDEDAPTSYLKDPMWTITKNGGKNNFDAYNITLRNLRKHEEYVRDQGEDVVRPEISSFVKKYAKGGAVHDRDFQQSLRSLHSTTSAEADAALAALNRFYDPQLMRNVETNPIMDPRVIAPPPSTVGTPYGEPLKFALGGEVDSDRGLSDTSAAMGAMDRGFSGQYTIDPSFLNSFIDNTYSYATPQSLVDAGYPSSMNGNEIQGFYDSMNNGSSYGNVPGTSTNVMSDMQALANELGLSLEQTQQRYGSMYGLSPSQETNGDLTSLPELSPGNFGQLSSPESASASQPTPSFSASGWMGFDSPATSVVANTTSEAVAPSYNMDPTATPGYTAPTSGWAGLQSTPMSELIGVGMPALTPASDLRGYYSGDNLDNSGTAASNVAFTSDVSPSSLRAGWIDDPYARMPTTSYDTTSLAGQKAMSLATGVPFGRIGDAQGNIADEQNMNPQEGPFSSQANRNAFAIHTDAMINNLNDQLTRKDPNITPQGRQALIGQAYDESKLFAGQQETDPLVAGSLGGLGLFQDTGPRRRALEAQYGSSPTASQDLDNALRELQTDPTYSRSYGALTNPNAQLADISRVLTTNFEAPLNADAKVGSRQRTAEMIGPLGVPTTASTYQIASTDTPPPPDYFRSDVVAPDPFTGKSVGNFGTNPVGSFAPPGFTANLTASPTTPVTRGSDLPDLTPLGPDYGFRSAYDAMPDFSMHIGAPNSQDYPTIVSDQGYDLPSLADMGMHLGMPFAQDYPSISSDQPEGLPPVDLVDRGYHLGSPFEGIGTNPRIGDANLTGLEGNRLDYGINSPDGGFHRVTSPVEVASTEGTETPPATIPSLPYTSTPETIPEVTSPPYAPGGAQVAAATEEPSTPSAGVPKAKPSDTKRDEYGLPIDAGTQLTEPFIDPLTKEWVNPYKDIIDPSKLASYPLNAIIGMTPLGLPITLASYLLTGKSPGAALIGEAEKLTGSHLMGAYDRPLTEVNGGNNDSGSRNVSPRSDPYVPSKSAAAETTNAPATAPVVNGSALQYGWSRRRNVNPSNYSTYGFGPGYRYFD